MKIFLAATVFLTFLAGCTMTGSWNDQSIPADVRSEVKARWEKVIAAFSNGDRQALESLCTAELVKDSPQLFEAVDSLDVSQIRNSRFTIRNEFYRKTSASGEKVVYTSGNSDRDYTIAYTMVGKESYGIVGRLETPAGDNLSVLIVFHKLGNDWKANILYIDDFTRSGKDIVDWFESGREHYENRHYADAGIAVLHIRSMIKPGGEFWHYVGEEKMLAFCDRVDKKVNETLLFPIAVEAVPSKPTIYTLNTENVNGSFYPIIEYVSQIDLNDSIAAERENEALHSLINNVFPGLDRNNKKILYRAWDPNVITKADGELSEFRGYMRNTQ